MPDFGLQITPRPDLPAIVARRQREITVPELQAGYFAILAAADAQGCSRWLLDMRRREELATPELNDWLNSTFLPHLLNRFPVPVRLAFLILPLRASREQGLGSAALLSSTPHPAQGYLSGLFTDEATAHEWLAS